MLSRNSSIVLIFLRSSPTCEIAFSSVGSHIPKRGCSKAEVFFFFFIPVTLLFFPAGLPPLHRKDADSSGWLSGIGDEQLCSLFFYCIAK